MKQSFCGLCDRCNLDNPEFREAVATIKKFFDQFWVYWWVNCFPEEAGFSLLEFRKGLEWFLSRPECPGCVAGKGLRACPIRQCAIAKEYQSCRECPDLDECKLFDLILTEYPDQKQALQDQQISG